MIALIVGTVLAVAALAFVLYPLFREGSAFVTGSRGASAEPAPDSGADRAVAALREVEFDRATGKLSDADYATLKATYTRDALAALRAQDAAAAATGGVSDDEMEAMILAYRSRRPECAVCGPRPEADAVYCSTCGRYLAGACARCGAAVTEPGARYCPSCGTVLAA